MGEGVVWGLWEWYGWWRGGGRVESYTPKYYTASVNHYTAKENGRWQRVGG